MTRRKIQYQWSDAWLLLATVHASANDEANIEGITEAGDGINHAIFSEEELAGGLSRLTTGGLVREKDGVFFPSSRVKRALSKTTISRRSIVKQLQETERLLGLIE
ncbi:MAG: hypothetical protein AABN33_19935 [Acidobacteriota bacterium]